PHLSYGQPETPPRWRRPAAEWTGRRPGRAVTDELRRGQDALDARSLPHRLGGLPRRTRRGRRRSRGGGRLKAPRRPPGRSGWEQDLAWQSREEGRWHRRAHAVG